MGNQPNLIKTRSEILKGSSAKSKMSKKPASCREWYQDFSNSKKYIGNAKHDACVQNDGRFCLHELTRYTRCECPMNRIGQNCAELAPQIAGPTPESYPVIAITALSFSAIAIVLIGLCYIRYKAKTDDTVKKRYMSRLV